MEGFPACRRSFTFTNLLGISSPFYNRYPACCTHRGTVAGKKNPFPRHRGRTVPLWRMECPPKKDISIAPLAYGGRAFALRVCQYGNHNRAARLLDGLWENEKSLVAIAIRLRTHARCLGAGGIARDDPGSRGPAAGRAARENDGPGAGGNVRAAEGVRRCLVAAAPGADGPGSPLEGEKESRLLGQAVAVVCPEAAIRSAWTCLKRCGRENGPVAQQRLFAGLGHRIRPRGGIRGSANVPCGLTLLPVRRGRRNVSHTRKGRGGSTPPVAS